MAWKNKKLQKEYGHRYYLKNRDKYIARAKKYYLENIDKVKESTKRNNWCKKNPEKMKITREKWKKNNPEKILAYRLMSRFGITIEQYNQLRVSQNNRCAICKKKETEFFRKMAIDHNHNTGKVRGLLCFSCNSILGDVNDNPNILIEAIKYLKKYE